MNAPTTTVTYAPPGPISKSFFEDQSFVRGIMGPLGSGKSTACVMEILKRSHEQAPSPTDGIRRTRWAIIRNTYPELKTTTLKTWTDWCPTHFGKLTQDSPIRHHVRTAQIDMEIYFMALDKDEDVKKLLSLELTGAWVNEARQIPKSIIDALTGRVGRYPSRTMGGCTWSGIMMDTNPPDDQSWWYRLAEEETPKGWRFFKQPAGDSADAENVANLPQDYYERMKGGKDEDWVKVYVKGEYGYVIEGKAVYEMFRDRIHVATERLNPVPSIPILIGVDFGLTPAAVIGQKLADGRWLILDELTTDGCGTERFALLLKSYIAQHYPDHMIGGAWGDPAGEQKAQTDERTALEILKTNTYAEWRWRSAPSNEFVTRRDVVVSALNRLVDGNPGFLLSPAAKTLRKGFASGYYFKAVKSANGTQYHDMPAKNMYSHPHDALQYLLLGAGEYDVITHAEKRKKTRAKVAGRPVRGLDYPIFGS